jgi:hypothetical protein
MNLPQNPVGNCADQRGSPPRLKPLYATAFHPRTDLGGDHLDQRIQGLIRLPEAFDLLNGVENCCVAAAVVKSADLGRALSHTHKRIFGT